MKHLESVSMEARFVAVYEQFGKDHEVPADLDDKLFAEMHAAIVQVLMDLDEGEFEELSQDDLYEAVVEYLEDWLQAIVDRRRFTRQYRSYLNEEEPSWYPKQVVINIW